VARALGILLAGGRGRRLSPETPKALVLLRGRTLLARALATLEALCDDVVVCAPGSLALPVDEARRVRDPEPGDGPLAGLVAGLSARPFERALALGVDLPFLAPATLAALGALLADAPAVVPAPGGRPQPLAAWYAATALAPLAGALAAGARALVPAVLLLPPRLVPDPELAALPGGIDAYFNLNTPDDLANAERRLAPEGER
jgi:molybdopterin-guanine dinucleotide biosynthesis protein A